MPTVSVDMWTDLGCPWSYIGRRRLELAFARVHPGEELSFTLHSFELNPNWPNTPIAVPEIFVKKHGGTHADAVATEAQVARLAAEVGLPFTVDRLASNSHTVLRVLQLAKEKGVAASWFADVQRGYFAGTLNPFDKTELTKTALATGLEADDISEAIETGRFDVAIERDRTDAIARGATGVPFFVIADTITVPGVATIDDYANAFRSLTAA